MSNQSGLLYIVATPIGNLEDISARAIHCLKEADLIAAEDTRHSKILLKRYGIGTHLTAFHEHNEQNKTSELINKLLAGDCIALISDAGTPLVSDPGYRLICAAHEAGIKLAPIPGPCAAIAALSVAGLPTDAFVFEGFPPAKTKARQAFFERLQDESRTIIFYESAHRVRCSLRDLHHVFGDEREAVIARELTKQFETIKKGKLMDLCRWLEQDPNQQKGEFVFLVAPVSAVDRALTAEAGRIMQILMTELPMSQAAVLAAKITGLKRGDLYRYGLSRPGR